MAPIDLWAARAYGHTRTRTVHVYITSVAVVRNLLLIPAYIMRRSSIVRRMSGIEYRYTTLSDFCWTRKGAIDVPDELRPEVIFNRRTWSAACYFGEGFAHLSQDIVLESRTRTGYGHRHPSYVCAPWWAAEVWDAQLGDRRARHAITPEYLRALSLGPILLTPTPLSVCKFASFHLVAREQFCRMDFARTYVLSEALYMTMHAFIHAAKGIYISAYRDPRLYTKEKH